MSLFLNLYVGHLLGDFLFQPGRLVAAKRAGVRGLAVHLFVLTASTAVVLQGRLARYWPAIAFVIVLHLAIEEATIIAYTRTATRPLYTFVFDQIMHVLSIALVVWMWGEWRATPGSLSFGISMPTIELGMIAAFGTVTLFGSVFAFELGNTALEGNASKGRLLKLDLPRVAGMVERAASLALAMFINPLLGLVPFVPRVALAYRSPAGMERKRGLIEAAAGLCTCAFCWLAMAAIRLAVDPGYSGAWWHFSIS